MSKLLKKINWGEMGIVFALLILWILCAIFNGSFRRFDTYMTVLRQASFYGIIGIGMTFCIISSSFDLSVASELVLCTCTCAVLIVGGMAPFLAILITIALGILLGAFNGFLIAKVRIPAFIATLAMMFTYRALAQLVAEGKPVPLRGESEQGLLKFLSMTGGKTLGIPHVFYILVILGIIATVVLRRTAIGRHITAIGNSEETSRISGIDVGKTKIIIFTIVGFFTAISAVCLLFSTANADFGGYRGYEFTVIASVVLGGTALAGGKGSIFTTIIAAIFMYSVEKALQEFGLPSQWRDMINGVILLFAFSINGIRAYVDEAGVKRRARKELAEKKLAEQTDAA